MDYDAFRGSPSGRLVPTIHDQLAFVPHPLPPALDLSSMMVEFGETMQAIGDLNGISRQLPNPYMVIRPLQRREALTSSSMEGTHASPDDLVLLEAGEEHAADDSTREVLNYIKALNEAERSLAELPISHRIITNSHRILLAGLSKHRGANKRPGEYKQVQNFIGGKTIEEARFMPPPPAEADVCMNQLEAYINRGDRDLIPPLVDAALIHYQFETIHPFADGNGRVGRILIPIFLIERGVLEKPLLYISPYLEDHKDKYIDLMYEVSRTGAWLEWISFFLRSVKASCREAIDTIHALRQLQDEYRERAHKVSRSGTAIRIVDSLFEKPVISIPDAAAIAGVTYPPAAAAVQRLVEAGILRELITETQPRRFMAPEVVMISAGIRKPPHHARGRPAQAELF
jgi:Fic family protein